MNRPLWKYRKKILYTEYHPISQLHVPETDLAKPRFPVVDCHTHFGAHFPGEPFYSRYDTELVVQQLQSLGVIHCIDLVLFDRSNWDAVLKKTQTNRGFFRFCAPIDLSGVGDASFSTSIVDAMQEYANLGCVGFKLWKELGLTLRNGRGELYSLTAPDFKPIWKCAARLNKPIVFHVADPPAFFQPADCYNERREEIVQYPFWHHYYQGLSFELLMEQLDALLGQNPDTTFLIPHLCSWPSNLEFVESLLHRHRNLYTDIAATLSEIGRQPRQFYRFACRWQDRILFGTDFFADGTMQHRRYFRFLETEDEYFAYDETGSLSQGRWMIYGCGLPDEVLQKLYFKNSLILFRISEDDLSCKHSTSHI